MVSFCPINSCEKRMVINKTSTVVAMALAIRFTLSFQKNFHEKCVGVRSLSGSRFVVNKSILSAMPISDITKAAASIPGFSVPQNSALKMAKFPVLSISVQFLLACLLTSSVPFHRRHCIVGAVTIFLVVRWWLFCLFAKREDHPLPE